MPGCITKPSLAQLRAIRKKIAFGKPAQHAKPPPLGPPLQRFEAEKTRPGG
jgi:hypothetical protein